MAGVLGLTLSTPAGAQARDISRDTLAANDGWAAADGGTTGGSTADDAHVVTVRNRSELVRALDGGSATPKIIRIAGTIDANTGDDGWTPTLHGEIDSARRADREVVHGAGAGRIR